MRTMRLGAYLAFWAGFGLRGAITEAIGRDWLAFAVAFGCAVGFGATAVLFLRAGRAAAARGEG